MGRGTLYIVSAPSGAGKSTLCNMLLQEDPHITFSVSYTTRTPRAGEQDGRDYYFIDRDRFLRMVDNGEFLEWAEVHGNLYGTSRQWIEEKLSEGLDVLLDIDVQGAHQIMEKELDGVYIFILPPSIEVLKERLSGRKTDPPDVISKRIKKAKEEISYFRRYDYVIINDNLQIAYKDLQAIIRASRLRSDRLGEDWLRERFSL